MEKLYGSIANAAAIIGILVCFLAGAVRISGAFRLLGFELMTLFLVGAGLLLLACLAKLYQLECRINNRT